VVGPASFRLLPGSALSQAVQVANDGGGGPVTLSLIFLPEPIVAPQLALDDQTPTPPPRRRPSQSSRRSLMAGRLRSIRCWGGPLSSVPA